MPTSMAFTDEQEELRRTMRRFCEDRSPSAEVRRLMASTDGYSPQVWEQMASQLGLQALTIPEQYGGAGFSFLELAIVLEEMGRALVCSPYFATIGMAANALLCSGDDDACATYLPSIATGETIGTLALAEDAGRWDENSIQLEAERSGADSWLLSGEKSFVVDGAIANLVLVAARSATGVSLFAVEGNAKAMTRTPLPTLDQTRKLARLQFERTPARLIGGDGQAWPALSRTLDLAAIALAAEEVGGAQRCLDMSVDYSKLRYQFGRPIGSFQAIKHRCADMLLQVESARSAAQYAAFAAAEHSDDVPVAASLAKTTCSDAYFFTAAETIQIHGGIGFTWDHDAHLYFKRAKSSQLFLGNTAYHRELLAQRIGV